MQRSWKSLHRVRELEDLSEAVTLAQQVENHTCDLIRKERGHGVSNLDILLSSVAFKVIIIREGLDSGGFSYGEASALT